MYQWTKHHGYLIVGSKGVNGAPAPTSLFFSSGYDNQKVDGCVLAAAMKELFCDLLAKALSELQEQGVLPTVQRFPPIVVSRTRDRQRGDYASPLALALARHTSADAMQLATAIVARISVPEGVQRIEVAAPGFINFFLAKSHIHNIVSAVLGAADRYGCSSTGKGRKFQVEFVSTNPTGPLHVGHGRGAAYGSVIANLLQTVGFAVQREYYLNDAGRQINILATSVWLRYLSLCGQPIAFPGNGYRGAYILDIARTLYDRQGADYSADAETLFAQLPPDAPQGDKEAHIDALIACARQHLGERYQVLHDLAVQTIVDDIRLDLEQFGVRFDAWFSERSLTQRGEVDRVIQRLQQHQHTYRKDGALWFRASAFGDEKDRVIEREGGERTYFASDIAYLAHKMERGFEAAIYIFGADHHGYVARLKAVASALGYDPQRIKIKLVQFAVLSRGGQKLQMSTRSGEFVTLRALREEVGNDAARFFYVMRRSEQHMDFDLDLAKSNTTDNPVYYVQYAHARIASVMRKAQEQGIGFAPDQVAGVALETLLTDAHEVTLLRTLARYTEVIEISAEQLEPHRLIAYLRELATDLHAWYNAKQFLSAAKELRMARLALAAATQQVIANGLQVIGVSAPDSM